MSKHHKNDHSSDRTAHAAPTLTPGSSFAKLLDFVRSQGYRVVAPE